ncbi:MAG: hypothetical protein K5792_12435 [Butyrivibrio sp.]|nr:hypothetical protein [Butyrivibrio sp.]
MSDEKINAQQVNSENGDAPLPENEPEQKRPESFVTCGFEFLSNEDLQKAKLDEKKISIIAQKVHSTKVSDLEEVYEKAISNKIFSTPIGWCYLSNLRDKLLEAGVSEEDLTPIPVNIKFTNVALPDEYHPRERISVPKKKKRDAKASMILLCAMNLILVILVIVMFIIAWKGDTDNIINYKQNVTNRFAEWEQSLKEREKAVRIKEKELSIEDATDYYQGDD